MNLTGPEFLGVYLALAAGVLLLNRMFRNGRESGGGQEPPRLSDPYLMACLRGGRDEAARVALVNLVQSGLLSYQGDTVTSASRALPSEILPAAERAVLDKGRAGVTSAHSMVKQVASAPEMRRYEEELRAGGLLPDGQQRSMRLTSMAVCLVVLWGAAGYRILDALSRGRRNVGFLVVLALAAGAVAVVQTFKRRTSFGDRTVAGMRALFAKAAVADAAGAGRAIAPREAAMLAGVWGVGALMAHNDFLFVPSLFPRAKSSPGDGCSSSCGSSCSSSDGGGGSCGGGGCGGCGGGD
ncbi:MAG: TIGR04222 domain-containing membrane protein [Bryobacteraceae bacterium]